MKALKVLAVLLLCLLCIAPAKARIVEIDGQKVKLEKKIREPKMLFDVTIERIFTASVEGQDKKLPVIGGTFLSRLPNSDYNITLTISTELDPRVQPLQATTVLTFPAPERNKSMRWFAFCPLRSARTRFHYCSFDVAYEPRDVVGE